MYFQMFEFYNLLIEAIFRLGGKYFKYFTYLEIIIKKSSEISLASRY